LIKQRIRWNLGYLETFWKERDFFYLQMGKLTNTGIRTLVDVAAVKLTMLFPLLVLVLIVLNLKLLGALLIGLYASFLVYTLTAMLILPEETMEFSRKRLRLTICFPVLKIVLECISWTGALMAFLKKPSGGTKQLTIEHLNGLTEEEQLGCLEVPLQVDVTSQLESPSVETSKLTG
jgi:cellulose synthase/poly-beta-1,6-N-acetylglucosamine synthase-like glycosyltransferase